MLAGACPEAEVSTTECDGALPLLIQGGMGVGVSGWRLASMVSGLGQLGVVSGTALAVVMARVLQDGDRGGHVRGALARFPERDVTDRILDRYLLPGGRSHGAGYRAVPVPRQRVNRHLVELTVAASFVEVSLAKQGHDGLIGINLLEKIQIPTLPTLYGAMLAGVDYVLMGAGVPLGLPAILDALTRHEPVELPLTVAGAAPDAQYSVRFDPQDAVGDAAVAVAVTRPRFLAIVSSHVLAVFLAREQANCPDGFVVERPSAGGHNASPRGRLTLTADGEPIYGARDDADLEKLRELGLPFWLAGGYGHPEGLLDARADGAAGVQVGTAFALCDESGLDPGLKSRVVEIAHGRRLVVRTDAAASPTGFPFKVAHIPGSIADPRIYAERGRRCDLGYLATPYHRPDGTIGYRCPGEPAADYVAKGGSEADTVGRQCLCNGLTAAIGLGQRRTGGTSEPPLLTLGDDAANVLVALSPDGGRFSAADVVRYVLGHTDTVTPSTI